MTAPQHWDMAQLHGLEGRLGVTFRDYSLLDRALTHRSYLNENPTLSLSDNERLEFLGDAIIDYQVAALLYHRFPEMDEGELTALRASLVRSETLADFARQMGIGPCLRLGVGEDENGGRDRNAILCATFEAVIGAIYLDQGPAATQALIDRLVPPALEHIRAQSLHKDAKSEFQVWAQGQFNITPRYEMIASEGPDHAKVFTVQVLVGDEVWGEGRGLSKQHAAQAAAATALLRAETADPTG